MLYIFSNDRNDASVVAEIFYYLGIVTASMAYSDWSGGDIPQCYRATLLISPDNSPAVGLIVKATLRAGAIPFVISDTVTPELPDGAIAVPSSCAYPALPAFIEDTMHRLGKRAPGEYLAAGICSHRLDPLVFADGRTLKLTKTELMIVRYLCASYPERRCAAQILSFAFRGSKRPEVSNIRTHVSLINKKAEATLGRHLISSVPREGYTILDA